MTRTLVLDQTPVMLRAHACSRLASFAPAAPQPARAASASMVTAATPPAAAPATSAIPRPAPANPQTSEQRVTPLALHTFAPARRPAHRRARPTPAAQPPSTATPPPTAPRKSPNLRP